MDRQDKEAFAALDELQPLVAPMFGNAIEIGMQAIETMAAVRKWLRSVEAQYPECVDDAMADGSQLAGLRKLVK